MALAFLLIKRPTPSSRLSKTAASYDVFPLKAIPLIIGDTNRNNLTGCVIIKTWRC
jgi:hypothetical protein